MRHIKQLLATFFILLALNGTANATLNYSSNTSSTGFDATTINTTPTGWTAIAGTWQVGTTLLPTGHSHTFSDTTHTDGHVAVYTSDTAAADMEETFGTTISAISGGNIGGMYPVFRSDTSYNNAYICIFTDTTHMEMFKKVSGSTSAIGSITALGFTVTLNHVIQWRATAKGTTISCKAWDSTSSEPSSAQISLTDSAVSGAGHGGLYNGDSVVTTVNAASDFDVNTLPNATYNAPLSPTAITSSGCNLSVNGTYTGTAPSAINWAVDGGGYTAAVSPTIGGNAFSFNITSPNTGFHEIETQDNGSTTTTGSAVYNVTKSGCGGSPVNLFSLGFP